MMLVDFVAKEDSSGVNTVGNGIGHDIITIDGDNSKKVILNDYYEEKDSYPREVEYSLNDLDPGSHTIEFKVRMCLIILPSHLSTL